LVSREATMLRGRREVRFCGCRWWRQRHQTHMGAQTSAPFAKHAGCFFRAQARCESRREVASQKLCRAPCRPIKASGLTWASVPAARSRRRRGSSELGNSSAGGPPTQRLFEAALGRPHTACAGYLAQPCQLVVVRPAGRAAGQSSRARSGTRTHGSIAGSCFAAAKMVPKIALSSQLPWWRSSLACLS